MTVTTPTPADFALATKDDILPRFVALLQEDPSCDDVPALEDWIRRWDDLARAVKEASLDAQNRYASDTRDPANADAVARFTERIDPFVEEANVALGQKLLATGYGDPAIATTLRNIGAHERLFREANIPLKQRLQETISRYSALAGSLTTEWDGETIPVTRLTRYFTAPDRQVRERAWRAQLVAYADRADAFEDLFDEQLALRREIAANAGFANYRDYAFVERLRFDYSPADCERFHDAVRSEWLPLTAEHAAGQRQALGVETLRPWDVGVDTDPAAAGPAYASLDDLHAGIQRILERVAPDFATMYHDLHTHDRLDLEARDGKRPGGFANPMPWSRDAVIVMNASGADIDIQIVLHEMGHAIHAILGYASQPLEMQNIVTEEIAEVASMTMELLTTPYLHRDAGGFYDDDGYRRALRGLWSYVVDRFPYICVVDAFQHWLYTDPAGDDRQARDAKWLELWDIYQPEIDWSGLERERTARKLRQLHLFMHPFYYIEYAIAQLGALQIWQQAQSDPSGAIARYRAALELAGTQPLPDLFAAAGARLIFDRDGMRDMAAFARAQVAAMSQGQ